MAATAFTIPSLTFAKATGARLQLHTPCTPDGLQQIQHDLHAQPVLLAGATPEVAEVRVTAESVAPTRETGRSITLFTDTAARLEKELAARTKPLKAVRINPQGEPFPPFSDVQEETAQVVECLAARGIEARLTTRGFIRPQVERVLIACRKHVKLTIPLTTLDRTVQRALEPLAASSRLRLRQAARLIQAGVAVNVVVEPLVPGLTDTRASLQPLLEALAAIGIRQISTGYLMLRPDTRAALIQKLEPHGWHDVVLDAFADGCTLKLGKGTSAWALSKSRRQRGYATVIALAAGLGITVRINAASNPDFCPPVADERPPAPRQPWLPGIESSRWPTLPDVRRGA